ncbi:MAG TPA: glutathione S-transferase N-terminal domain-containing protein [Miltoncostaeales bacterium]|nr:glutathione S-transferase N-terminal domain-containing protein [Miltoncostaeales bacterium]
MILLYQLRKCPWAAAVRQTLANVEQDYGVIQVPYDRSLRHEVRAMTGQELTPVLVDGDVVVNESRRAVAYLYETYGNARQHERAQELRDEINATASAGDGEE